jgi:hypothetical protein
LALRSEIGNGPSFEARRVAEIRPRDGGHDRE